MVAIDWSKLLTQGLPALTGLNPSANTSTGGFSFGLPRLLEQGGGIAALLAGLQNQPTVEIPNYQDFASPAGNASTSYLRGAFESPADPFAPGGVFEKYLPFIEQQEKSLLDDVQQRALAGLPGSLSARMGGGELADIRSAAANELLPRRQALFGDLTRENMARQQQAATTLGTLERFGQDSGFKAALTGAQNAAEFERQRNNQLAQLGLALLLGGGGGSGTTVNVGGQPGGAGTGTGTGTGAGTGQGGAQGALSSLASYLQGQLSPAQLAQQLLTPSNIGNIGNYLLQAGGVNSQLGQAISQALGTTLGVDAAMAGQGLSGVTVMTSYGSQIPIEALSGISTPAGTSAAGIAGAVGKDFGLPGAGLLGPAGIGSGAALLSSLGAGAAGFGAGTLASNLGQNQFQATAGGALGGAALGFATGGPIGAAIGAVVGGITGLMKEGGQQKAQKAEFLKADLDSQKDQVYELGNIGAEFMARIPGLPQTVMNDFASKVQQLASTSDSPADEQAQVAGMIKAVLDQYGAGLDRNVLRGEFIDYMTRNTFTSGNSAYGGGAPLNFIGAPNIGAGGQVTSWRELAGLKSGGHLPYGGRFLVGENGPEILDAAPGTTVIPLLSGRN